MRNLVVFLVALCLFWQGAVHAGVATQILNGLEQSHALMHFLGVSHHHHQDNLNDLTNIWLGDPLPLVLSSLSVEKGDPNDPVLKFFPDTNSFITLLTLQFTEFETGTYSSRDNKLKSKSEISVDGG